MQSTRDEDAAAVLQRLRILVHKLRATAHSVERDLGLTGAQLFVLGELAAEPNVSVRRLAERTMTDPSSASVVVTRLLEKGLVARARDPADRRRSVLSLTSTGQAILERAPQPYQARLFAALQTLPRQQLRQLQQGLSALLGPLDAGDVPLFFEEEAPVGAKGKRRARSS